MFKKNKLAIMLCGTLAGASTISFAVSFVAPSKSTINENNNVSGSENGDIDSGNNNQNSTKTNYVVNTQLVEHQSSTFLSTNFITNNKEKIDLLIESEITKNNDFVKDAKILKSEISFDELKGEIYAKTTIDKMLVNNEVNVKNFDVTFTFKGFKQESFNLEIIKNNETFQTNQKYSVSSKITSLSNDNLDGIEYQWETTNGLSITTNGNSQMEFNAIQYGAQTITLNAFKNINGLKTKISTNSITIYVEQAPLFFPDDTELLLTGKTLKYSGYVFEQKLSREKTYEKLNEYGALKSFALITKMYSNSTIMEPSNFEDVRVNLLDNQNFDFFKFEIKATATKDVNNFGLFPFAGITNGWNGYNLKAGDKVRVIFTYKRSFLSNAKGQNKFDINKVSLGPQVSSDFSMKWHGLSASPSLNLPYTTDFLGGCQIYVNNNKIKWSDSDNRVFFAFVYNHKNEYSQNGNQDIYMLCDNTCITR